MYYFVVKEKIKGIVYMQERYLQQRGTEGYDHGQYVQDRTAKSKTDSSICRPGLWKVEQWAICAGMWRL